MKYLSDHSQGASAELTLNTGDKIKITTDDKFKEKCSKDTLWVDYKNITKVMSVGSRMFIDDGLISVIVKEMGHFLGRHHRKIVKCYMCAIIVNEINNLLIQIDKSTGRLLSNYYNWWLDFLGISMLLLTFDLNSLKITKQYFLQ